jgi:cbb3-type cytochrome oxidase subunit 3
VTTTGYLAFGLMVVCVLLYLVRRRARQNRDQ